LFHIFQSLAR